MITVILIAIAYVFIGSIIGSRHHAITTRNCEYRYGKLVKSSYDSSGKPYTCFEPNWCNHVMTSVWFYGLVWWLALPITAGFLIGGADKATRTEKRRASELAEAKHQAELAVFKRREDEELTRQLDAINRRRA